VGRGRTEHPECDRCSLDCCRARDAVCLILGSISTVAAGTSAATCTVGQGFGPRQRARQSPSGMMNLSIRRSTLDLPKRQTLCQALEARGTGRVVPDKGRRWPHPRLCLFRGRADAPELLQALVQGRRPGGWPSKSCACPSWSGLPRGLIPAKRRGAGVTKPWPAITGHSRHVIPRLC